MFQDWDDLKRQILEIKVSFCGDSEYVLLLEDHSYTNFISSYMVERLEMPYVMIENPYFVQKRHWVDRCLELFFSLDEYPEEVWCDMVPIKTCHMFLENLWFQWHKISYEQEWYKFVMDKWRKLLFPPISRHHKILEPYSNYSTIMRGKRLRGLREYDVATLE